MVWTWGQGQPWEQAVRDWVATGEHCALDQLEDTEQAESGNSGCQQVQPFWPFALLCSVWVTCLDLQVPIIGLLRLSKHLHT